MADPELDREINKSGCWIDSGGVRRMNVNHALPSRAIHS